MRTLSRTEEEKLWIEVKASWGWKGYYWYPLDGEGGDGLLALSASRFEEAVGERAVKDILVEFGVKNAYRLREFESGFEFNVDDDMPYLYESESVIVDMSYKWIIYSSHEDSITFGGAPLVNELKRKFPVVRELDWFKF